MGMTTTKRLEVDWTRFLGSISDRWQGSVDARKCAIAADILVTSFNDLCAMCPSTPWSKLPAPWQAWTRGGAIAAVWLAYAHKVTGGRWDELGTDEAMVMTCVATTRAVRMHPAFWRERIFLERAAANATLHEYLKAGGSQDSVWRAGDARGGKVSDEFFRFARSVETCLVCFEKELPSVLTSIDVSGVLVSIERGGGG